MMRSSTIASDPLNRIQRRIAAKRADFALRVLQNCLHPDIRYLKTFVSVSGYDARARIYWKGSYLLPRVLLYETNFNAEAIPTAHADEQRGPRRSTFCRELLQSKKRAMSGSKHKNETFGTEDIE